jgi:hypothetical protein
VRISAGIARTGLSAIKRRRELHLASAAISALHDALLAVAQGKITPDQVRDFFWHGQDVSRAEYFGDVLTFEEKSGEAT